MERSNRAGHRFRASTLSPFERGPILQLELLA